MGRWKTQQYFSVSTSATHLRQPNETGTSSLNHWRMHIIFRCIAQLTRTIHPDVLRHRNMEMTFQISSVCLMMPRIRQNLEIFRQIIVRQVAAMPDKFSKTLTKTGQVQNVLQQDGSYTKHLQSRTTPYVSELLLTLIAEDKQTSI